MKFISSDKAPEAIGPYSQAIGANGFVFLSGQIPIDPATGQIKEGGIDAQTRQVFTNMEAVLNAAGVSLRHVIKTTVFLKNISDFSSMNAVYEELFDGHKPVRSTVEVAALPRSALIEIECVAVTADVRG